MNKELKCPNCQQKDREIVILKSELAQARYVLNCIFDMARHNNGVLYFRQDNGTWKIETGKENDVLTNLTNNDVGSMEEIKK